MRHPSIPLFRTATAAFAALFLVSLISSCDKDEEAEVVVSEVDVDTGGNGGNGGGGGGSNAGLIDPASIDITSEGLFSCDGGGTDFVVYDSTGFQQQLFTTTPLTVTSCQFLNFNGEPYSVQIQLYGMSIVGPDATQAEMDAFFAPGDRPYSMAAGTTPGAFISIVRESSDMTTWYQTNLNAQPSSSNFTITDAQGYMDGAIYKVKIRATFTCKMWSVQGSNSMDCVDGIFVGDFTSDAL